MNVVMEFIGTANAPKYRLESGNTLPLQRGFMDDLTLMSLTVKGARLLLQHAIVVLKWARMQTKATKSRSCVVKSGRCMNVKPFEVNGEEIKSIQQKPVKSLGRWIDGDLSDRKARVELEEKFQKGMKDLDKALVTGMMKLWIFQHLLYQDWVG